MASLLVTGFASSQLPLWEQNSTNPIGLCQVSHNNKSTISGYHSTLDFSQKQRFRVNYPCVNTFRNEEQ